KDISDSIFLETYYNSFMGELEKYKINVFTQEYSDSFLFIKTPAYVLNIAQIEVEEYYLEQEDSQEYGSLVYYKTMYLDALSINTWLEIARLNADDEGRQVLYASRELSDYVDGYFTQNLITGDVRYKYNLSDVDIHDVYYYAAILGELHASWTFDHILNENIAENWPPEKKRRYYLHFNRKQGSFDPVTPGFSILED
ncbi:MAG: hypothetical protein K8R53_02805, partial [Bacteroidales bacterium]|nr:hypothetical protein [Bacteroidales bacterium]